MNPELLTKYLNGRANEAESQRCEAYLTQSTSPAIGLEQHAPDELLESLRATDGQSQLTHVDSLVERIQRLVPRKAIGAAELERTLGEAVEPEDLGTIGDYRVLEYIASGGMGLVFKGYDPKLEREVCIKILHPALATNQDAKQRFARESVAAAKLRHERIVTVLDVGKHKDLPFLVMKLLDGMPLREKLNRDQPLSCFQIRRIVSQVAEALRYAHRLGYLHRDIKPENIWLTNEGDVKLLDFGLARAFNQTTNITQTGAILGTPGYMSPEQIRGDELDARSDLFSLGTVMYEMLFDESPFARANLFSTMMAIANDTPSFVEPADASSVNMDRDEHAKAILVEVTRQLLEKDLEQRIDSTESLLDALEALHPDPMKSRPPTPKPQASAKGVWPVGLAIMLGAALVALGMWLYLAQDKGTLVIEADPTVNISKLGDLIMVQDPVSKRTYQVRIGEKQLPSGVYNLELSDGSGELTLSSSQIVIRRGEKQIVMLKLIPPNVVKSVGPAETPAADTPSKLPGKTAQHSISLAELPAIDSLAIRKGQLGLDAIGHNLSLAAPPKRQGITGWSIEPKLHASWRYATTMNTDGSRRATVGEDSFVRVWNREGQLTHLLPTYGTKPFVRWSPDPNIFGLVENSEACKRVSIWRLKQQGSAEILQIIPEGYQDIAWSRDGLELALCGEDEILFYDLVSQKRYAKQNLQIEGTISQQPWSHDGRLFAVTVEDNLKIWDLEAGTIYHSISNAQAGRFHDERNAIAVTRDSKKDIEIWNLDRFVLERSVKDQFTRLDSSKSLVTNPGSLGPQLRHLLVVEGEKCMMKNLETNAESPIEFDDETAKTRVANALQNTYTKFSWSDNGFSLIVDSRVFIESMDDGGKTKWRACSIDSMSQGARYLKSSQTKNGVCANYHYVLDESGRSINRSYLHRVSFTDLATRSEVVLDDPLLFTTPFSDLSESGKHWAVYNLPKPTQSESVDQNGLSQPSQEANRLKILSTETGKVVANKQFTGTLLSLRFLPGPNRLLIALRTKNKYGRFVQQTAIYDWQLDKVKVLRAEQAGQSINPVLSEIGRTSTVTSKYILIPNRTSVSVFDNQSGEFIKELEFEQLSSVSGLRGNTKFVWVLGRRKSERGLNSSNRRNTPLIDLEDLSVHEILFADADQNQVFEASPSDPLIATKSKYNKLVNIFKYDPVSKKTEAVASDQLRNLKDPKMVWHSSMPFLACFRRYEPLVLFDVTSNQIIKVNLPGIESVSNSQDGWVVFTGSRIYQLDLRGKILESLLVSMPFKPGFKPQAFDQYISADGSYSKTNASNLRVVQLRDNQFETLTMEEFEASQK